MADELPSLLSLEEELTCCICLSTFEHPVTTPCGHNFCLSCLDMTWQESELVSLGFNCPQCRTHFATKPELQKNTVLSNVVATFKIKSKNFDAEPVFKTEPKAPEILCDSCREAKASKTCLTCMASFCQKHVRPHEENPIFASHQLTEPLADLLKRICPDHHKLMEFYCLGHGRCICSLCLQQVHKNCKFSSPDEQRLLQESELKKKLSVLDGKIEKNQMVMSQMKEQQCVLKDSAVSRKRALEAEYRRIRDLIDRDEKEAMRSVDQELENGQSKLMTLNKRFGQNVEQMTAAKERISSLLAQTQTLEFLQANVDLPSVVSFDPYSPRLTVESKCVMSYHAFTTALKEHLENIMKEPVENRVQLLKPGTPRSAPDNVGPIGNFSPPNLLEPDNRKKQPSKKPNKKENKGEAPMKRRSPSRERSGQSKDQSMDHGPGRSMARGQDRSKGRSVEPLLGFSRPKGASMENLLDMRMPSGGNNASNPTSSVLNPAKRSDLLQYATVLNMDAKTAHKRITLSENFTRALVSDEPSPYPDSPARFSVCSQVLCTKGFSHGRHYWEVKMSSHNFCGLGLAYNSIDRKGPTSRLGRNAQSWCVEWFNVKLSAWHNSMETVLQNPNPSRVGILLDCEEGSATFYNVADRAYPFHTFIFPFKEAVYPAFWIFSSGTSISLCKMNN